MHKIPYDYEGAFERPQDTRGMERLHQETMRSMKGFPDITEADLAACFEAEGYSPQEALSRAKYCKRELWHHRASEPGLLGTTLRMRGVAKSSEEGTRIAERLFAAVPD